MWLTYAFLSAFTAALVAIFGKLGLRDIDTTLATTVRSIIMAAFLVLTSLSLGKFRGFSLGSLGSRGWLLIALAGLAGALSWFFYFLALKDGAATQVVVIDRLSLVFVALLGVLFLGEMLTWKATVGLALIVAGAVLVILK